MYVGVAGRDLGSRVSCSVDEITTMRENEIGTWREVERRVESGRVIVNSEPLTPGIPKYQLCPPSP